MRIQAVVAAFVLFVPLLFAPEATTVVWSADHETGDLSQWYSNNPYTVVADSGYCYRPSNGVSTEQAHSGQYAIKTTLYSRETWWEKDSGCRTFRKPEAHSVQTLYYSAWFYMPEPVTVGTFWNVLQFKWELDNESEVAWKIEIRNYQGSMYPVLFWKGLIEGPRQGDGLSGQWYAPDPMVPIQAAQWFHLEVGLRQSEGYDGQIAVWLNDELIFNEDNVRTTPPGGHLAFSVNNYGRGISPYPNYLYIDDVAVSTDRVGEVKR